MPYERANLRIERFHAEIGHHAAFNYWNVRGILAEKWGHGPDFGARGEGPEQIALTPEVEAEDRRIQAVYGLGGSGLVAEGPLWVPRARELAVEWIRDAYDVLRPKRTVRAVAQIFALYPSPDAVQLSRRLRTTFYRRENLEATLPERLHDQRDTFHAAIDWIVPDGEGGATSLIAGAVGPIHRSSFFAWPDEDRDNQWWQGFNLTLGRMNADPGLEDPVRDVEELVASAFTDIDQVAASVLQPLLQ